MNIITNAFSPAIQDLIETLWIDIVYNKEEVWEYLNQKEPFKNSNLYQCIADITLSI